MRRSLLGWPPPSELDARLTDNTSPQCLSDLHHRHLSVAQRGAQQPLPIGRRVVTEQAMTRQWTLRSEACRRSGRSYPPRRPLPRSSLRSPMRAAISLLGSGVSSPPERGYVPTIEPPDTPRRRHALGCPAAKAIGVRARPDEGGRKCGIPKTKWPRGASPGLLKHGKSFHPSCPDCPTTSSSVASASSPRRAADAASVFPPP